MANDTNRYEHEYSESGFWEKIQRFAKAAGKELIEVSLQLYFAMQSSNTPVWAKTVIIGALGYFISPVDAVPDLIPGVGFVDDLGVVTMAAATVVTHIDDETKAKASDKVDEWFGD